MIVEDETRFLNKIANPLYFFINLQMFDIKEIQQGIQENRKILHPSQTQIFWGSLASYCSIVIDILHAKHDPSAPEVEPRFTIKDQEVPSKYKNEIENILRGKNEEQLKILKKEIEGKLEEPKFFMDKNYWANLLLIIRIEINKLIINRFYKDFKDYLDTSNIVLEKEDAPKEEAPAQEIKPEDETEQIAVKNQVVSTVKKPIQKDMPNLMTQKEYQKDLQARRQSILRSQFKNFIQAAIGQNDLSLMRPSLSLEQICTKLEGDISKIQDLVDYGKVQPETTRQAALHEINEQQFKELHIARLRRKEREEMLPHEKITHNLLSLEAHELKPEEIALMKSKDWIDTLTPRKPHYFNRVHFGYEWTNHNLAHYTLDNPPPKDVMGYRFNIFYPNLVNPNAIPKYEIELIDNPDFAIIKFDAGPPYEQLRFKIVNKEWDFADRKGFKCLFDRGILHLYFDFVRNRFLV